MIQLLQLAPFGQVPSTCDSTKNLYRQSGCCTGEQPTSFGSFFATEESVLTKSMFTGTPLGGGWTTYLYETMGRDSNDHPVTKQNKLVVHEDAPDAVHVSMYLEMFDFSPGFDIGPAAFPMLATPTVSEILTRGRKDTMYVFADRPNPTGWCSDGPKKMNEGFDSLYATSGTLGNIGCKINADAMSEPTHKRVWKVFGYDAEQSTVHVGGSLDSGVVAEAMAKSGFADVSWSHISHSSGADISIPIPATPPSPKQRHVNVLFHIPEGASDSYLDPGWREKYRNDSFIRSNINVPKYLNENGYSLVSRKSGYIRSPEIISPDLPSQLDVVVSVWETQQIKLSFYDLTFPFAESHATLWAPTNMRFIFEWITGQVDSLITYTQTDVTDYDGDGVSYPADCNDYDPRMYPGAPSLSRGWDDNCDGSFSSSEVFNPRTLPLRTGKNAYPSMWNNWYKIDQTKPGPHFFHVNMDASSLQTGGTIEFSASTPITWTQPVLNDASVASVTLEFKLFSDTSTNRDVDSTDYLSAGKLKDGWYTATMAFPVNIFISGNTMTHYKLDGIQLSSFQFFEYMGYMIFFDGSAVNLQTNTFWFGQLSYAEGLMGSVLGLKTGLSPFTTLSPSGYLPTSGPSAVSSKVTIPGNSSVQSYSVTVPSLGAVVTHVSLNVEGSFPFTFAFA